MGLIHVFYIIGNKVLLPHNFTGHSWTHVFGTDMLFNLSQIIYWIVLSKAKQQQVYNDILHENTKKLSHDYMLEDIVYFDKTGIYHTLDYKNGSIYNNIILHKKYSSLSMIQNKVINKHKSYREPLQLKQ